MYRLLFLVATTVMLADAEPKTPYLLYSNLTSIGSVDLGNLSRMEVITGLSAAVPLAVDSVDKKIYLGEFSKGEIYRANMNGSGLEMILSNIGKVEGLAIDWSARVIYWTSYTSEMIEVATLDGKHRKVLFYTGLEYPRGLAVDPSEGYLFWTDWGQAAAVERSTLAGGNRTKLVGKNITWPNGMTIDYTNKLVYWIDAYHDTIESIDYNGGNRRKIFEDTFLTVTKFHGFDLDYINGDIYWTDWLSNTIYGLRQTKPKSTIFRNITIPTTRRQKGLTGLVVVDPSRQPKVSNRCGFNNGDCQQLCLLEPNGFQCACQAGMKLNDDGKTCKNALKDEFIMFADAGVGKIYQMRSDEVNDLRVAIPFGPDANISRPVALEYDPVEDRVYWTDVTLQIISRVFRNGTKFEKIVTENVGVADGLTVDVAGRNLYWTSTTHNVIEVARLDGSFRRWLAAELHEPRDIIVDSLGGYMYWTDWGVPRIERALMDGSNRTELINTGIRWPNGLTIDHVYNKLYWADAREDSIETLDLETGVRSVIVNEKTFFFWYWYTSSTHVLHPFGLTLLHEHIYWTDWYSLAVYRADINTGGNVTRLADRLGKPMDIHAYNIKPTQEHRRTYTFSFPSSGSNFTCSFNRTCAVIDAPPPCPAGYNTSREGEKCGLYCRTVVGRTYRCPCRDWKECAVKERYIKGCSYSYPYANFRVRECIQVVRPGRCPYDISKGSLQACVNDESCPGSEKCCNSTCAQVQTTATHPCQTNNGGCDQLCIPVPGGRRCLCKTDYTYNKTAKQCVKDPNPPRRPACPPLKSLGNGTVLPFPGSPKDMNCTHGIVEAYQRCSYKCNDGFVLKAASSVVMCRKNNTVYSWSAGPAECVENQGPKFTYCPNDILNATRKGKSYTFVSWPSPRAIDDIGHSLPAYMVSPYPYRLPPFKLSIGVYNITYRARDSIKNEEAFCRFSVEVRDMEPPSFRSTCPKNITAYVDGPVGAVVLWQKPNATDNSGKTPKVVGSHSPGRLFPIGETEVVYTATDDAGLETKCLFTITVTNECSSARCDFGAKCRVNASGYPECVCDRFCRQVYDPVCGSDRKTYPNLCEMKTAICIQKKNISVLRKGACESCSSITCDFASTCEVKNGLADCICKQSCTDKNEPVCGSDGVTYENDCKLEEAMCSERRHIKIIKREDCGCHRLNMDDAYKNSSSLACKKDADIIKCNTNCNSGHATVFPAFLKLQCYSGRWIRGNGRGKYVPINIQEPPRCYQETSINNEQPHCRPGYEHRSDDVCVSCPPGTFYSKDTSRCQMCDVTQYQDQAGQLSCKKCSSQMTTTAKGAENCYFRHAGLTVAMTFTLEVSQQSVEEFRKLIASELTKLCSNRTCTFKDINSNNARRRRRDQQNLVFKSDHVVVISWTLNQNKVKAELFVLDPRSTALIPEKAFSSEGLKELLLLIARGENLPYSGISVGAVRAVGTTKGPAKGPGKKDDSSSSKVPMAVGIVVAFVILIVAVFVFFMFMQRRRQKRRLDTPSVPPVQFTQDPSGGTMQIGQPNLVANGHNYENPEAISHGAQHGFVNQVYSQVNDPPPYYANTGVGSRPKPEAPHVYETPNQARAGALPEKPPLPEDAVVELVPAKKDEARKAVTPEKFFQKRSSENVYSLPQGGKPRETPGYEQPVDTEASLKLDPPPKYDDAKLQFMRDKAASSILPNVPRKKKAGGLDKNENETGGAENAGKSSVQNLSDATKGQSDS